MKMKLQSTLFATLAAIFLGAIPQGLHAAHESNNMAMIESDDDSVEGHAIVNYVKGKESWTATVRVGDLAPGIYWFAVRFNNDMVIGEPQPVCMIEANRKGNASCSNQMFDLGGFHEALILDADGNIVASGFFDRRGGKRVSD